MNDRTPIEEMKVASSHKGKDPKSRSVLLTLFIVWLLTVVAGLFFAWQAYFDKKQEALTLAQQIAVACAGGDFGPGVSSENQKTICSNANKVIQGDPGLQGTKGDQGIAGPRGLQGLPGHSGRNGKNGKSGKNGVNGVNGKNGSDGRDGTDGFPGATGPPGPEGPPGPAGIAGETGPMGPQGPSGVVNVETIGCEGPIIHQLVAYYDADTQTVTITCN